ncbi:MAG: iron dicitrate transport regulator FecR [Bacteroidetes bacterium]|jgi:transmembrane sensor|nr:iron dicitrate transport regulator FecR [Bacteroidota bacterium]
MSIKDKKQTGILDYIVDLVRRYERGEVSNSMKQALDRWTPDTADTEGYPMDEQKSALARDKVSRHVTAHIRHDLRRMTTRPRWRNVYQRYAALAAIVVLIGSGVWTAFWGTNGFLQPETNTLANVRKTWTTDDTHRTKLILPDGTIVQVNAGSRIEIAEAAFNKQKREVWLTGEAFFEVAKNRKKPFIIHTRNIQTTVLGTSFNVKAYPQLNEDVISVRNGRVEISENKKRLGVLTANHQLNYNNYDHTVMIANANWQDAAGWTKGRLVLNRAGMEELKLRLLQQFGVKTIIEQDALKGKYISGAFGTESTLTEVMNTICAIHNIHYQINGSKITITP